ncbi:phage tail assembly protein [Cohaesibacter sp. CAU 1516]|uniref:phage tail assembly protein n=1 Tax=Cohaesibacter sp. CAU 1516 TaxID=2576038 RepID=UPI0010FF42A8|nr:phage tail assembly protein [Cohaesibacter sp. CAU 1516]TLP42684.1 phage tail assembly protein [Cohaesibacter sp. CAU 1516]
MTESKKKLTFSDLTFKEPTGGDIIDFYAELDEKEPVLVSYCKAAALMAGVTLDDIRSMDPQSFWSAAARGKAAFFPDLI